jgi:hypothetical protein
MTDHITEDELQAEATEGFKVGAKKTINEYQQLGELVFVSAVLLLTSKIPNLLSQYKNASESHHLCVNLYILL